MTQYKTKDGQEIKVGGVYLIDSGNKFKCLGFKSDGEEEPICGIKYTEHYEIAIDFDPTALTSLPESQPEYDPEQMWVVYQEKVDNGIREFDRYTTYASALECSKCINNAFAIAPVGKKFKRGSGL